ncbi:hypothetical protein [Actinoplanes palleronii]|uniref:Uncharacterized protein n=1 Tax=Actinoplanes palleronii TaxID=113570 RepID=A0ABQ4BSU5_9ACTN|nr:hypothetical protein [Actinoplanes palleronii]GIE73768.1 hypothetical protein Apa02nite_098760 [Actinoplanes palleronii]
MWDEPTYPKWYAEWPKEIYVRWVTTWTLVYWLAQTAGTATVLSADDLMTGLFSSVFHLLAGWLSMNLLWIVGRRRGPVAFRALSLLVVLLVGFTVECCVANPSMALPWLVVSLGVAAIIRRPKPLTQPVRPWGSAGL